MMNVIIRRPPTSYLKRTRVFSSFRTHPNVKCVSGSHKIAGPSDLQLSLEVITPEEEQLLTSACDTALKRRRYEKGHWDGVISNYKEVERLDTAWNDSNITSLLTSIRHDRGIFDPTLEYLPSVHVIDLAPTGFIKPHVDSVKFSGQIVAGLSLQSSCVMRFAPEADASAEVFEVLLPPRSMYLMRGNLRYKYTHEILDTISFKNHDSIVKQRRLSLIFRDKL